MIKSYRLFPILLVILTGILTLWLDKISRWQPTNRDLDPSKPEFVAEHFVATRFDLQGKLLNQLLATKMWQYPGKPDLFFETPDLRVYQNGILQYQAQGETGRYNHKANLAWFDHKATLHKPADTSGPETTIYSSAMFIDMPKHLVQSPAPTTAHYGNSVASSVGFIYEQQAGIIKLLSKAQITYEK